MIAACCWEFLEPYLARNLGNRGLDRPTPKQVLEEFTRVWPEMAPFLDDPEGWIASQFGGSEFKVNLHHGLHFVDTKNFGPAGEPRWAEHRGDKGHVEFSLC